ncbi:hypothetical protein Q0Z83_042690 [Actinoplanes sichuanensis]|uniref:DUF397 domain-containing protein n=1 Tax=Actinoplanes sichuanensis TaxID=512349 RepID=A0ABW4A7Z3_9ACTN|nr:DUF397 domain-containing protein [Actinoplanes sichuanensis]BEL06078.1 hypothetical protein Q0Z83_042690 [Actinoplanes sichuanensis]
MTSTNLDGAVWHKSTRSGQDGNCVEVADNLPHVVAVRDTKDRDGGTLTFSPEGWATFLDAVKAGEFDCDTK